MILTNRQLATTLAALRHFQSSLDLVGRGMFDHFQNELTPLDDNEIDDLCERLNVSEVVDRNRPSPQIDDEGDLRIKELTAAIRLMLQGWMASLPASIK